jgi:hypothetical protein
VIRRGLFAGVAVVAVGLVVGAAPAISGTGLQVATSKQKDGPFSTDSLSFNMEPVETKTAWIRAKNKTNGKLKGINLTIAKKAVKDAFKVRYFDGKDNITQAVRTGGHNFKLEAGEATKFKAKIEITDEGVMCFMAEVNHPSAGDANAFVTVNTDC